MATPKLVRTHRSKHSDTALSREWRINMANTKKLLDLLLCFDFFLTCDFIAILYYIDKDALTSV